MLKTARRYTQHTPVDGMLSSLLVKEDQIIEPNGEKNASDVDAILTRTVYTELRRLASSYVDRLHKDPARIQATALVHEAYLKLTKSPDLAIADREHFLAVAASAMRQVLIDQHRYRHAAKRGGNAYRITLVDHHAVTDNRELDFLDLNDAIDRLIAVDPRAGRVVEMRIFADADETVIAHVLGVSTRTVRSEWAFARSWLRCELGRGHPPRPDGAGNEPP
ncbi:MAG TPA: RNA polymerase subunit sigma-24 [Phycisphaerales bacterium]|nr:RNA polymerase subunit sigma-24 [Phycisphaerales bacterium]